MLFRMLPLILTAALLAAPGTADAADVPPGLAATWRATSQPEAARDQAIERVVGRMAFFKRGFARKKLQESVPLCRTVKIWETDDHQLAIQCDGGRAAVAPLDGSSRTWTTPEGDTYTLTHRVTGDRVIQTFRGSKGTKEAEWVVHDGSLEMKVRIESPHLPEDLEFDTSFAS